MKRVWCCYLFCIFFYQAYSQTAVEKVKFSRLDPAATLSNSRVTCVLQDSDGFLWVGTEDGLNRFDGYEFKIYRNNPSDSTSLIKNSILQIYEDSRGGLWVSTANGGLHRYNHTLDNFTRLNEYSFDCEIRTFYEDRDYIWIAGVRSYHAFVDKLSKTTGKTLERHTLFPSKAPVQFLMRATDNSFWVGVRTIGFFKWNVKTNQSIKYAADRGNPESIISDHVHKAVVDGHGDIWIGTEDGLSKFDIRKETFTNYILTVSVKENMPSVNDIQNLCIDTDYLWLGTENGGLFRFNMINGKYENFVFNKYDPTSLPDNSVWAIYKDHEGRIWIGTYSKGICVIDRMKEKFLEVDIPLENDIVNAIWQDSKKRFWIGTEDGIVMKQGNEIKHYRHSADKGSITANPIISIYEDSKQRMWFGTWNGGLNRYDEKTNSFVSYVHDPKRHNSLSNNDIFAIAQLRDTGAIVAGSYNGVNILTQEKEGIFQRYNEPEFEFNNYVRTLQEDSKGNLWIGTIEELTLFDNSQKKIVRFESFNERDSMKIDGLSNCIMEDRKGRIWVGTNNGLHLIINKKHIRSYTTANGLPNNIISGILEDRQGNLWLSTTNGISRFNPDKQTFKNYDVNDGLLSNEFKPNACFKNKEGQFFFGGKGVNVFYPDSIKDNPHVPPVFITDLKLLNKSVKVGDKDGILSQQISKTLEVSLPPDYNFFTINYVALNFTASNKNQYAYKLEGFDKEWNYVGSQRAVTFTNLDPGDYIFKVKASNNDGLWNEEGAFLIIHILPPWWKTWWVRSLAVVLVTLLAVVIYKVRLGSVTRQNRRLEEVVEARTRELALQNEELLQSQEEISSQRDLVSAQNHELQFAREIIEKQNNEIKLRNETLEAEVEERTRDLVEYNQQLEQFAFISAHNLRAPVARILGLGNVLEITRHKPEEVNMIIDRLIFTTQELDRVVKDLNTVLELRKNNTSVITRINLEEELELIKINLEKEIQETHTVFDQDFSQINTIYTLKPYLDSILVNLISNAIKYRQPSRPPVIRIRSVVEGDLVCLEVRDNGLGMDLSLYKDKIFTLYSRFHSHVEGKGMGLYLVKTQANSLGGRIEVDSATGIGTTFKVYIRNQAPA